MAKLTLVSHHGYFSVAALPPSGQRHTPVSGADSGIDRPAVGLHLPPRYMPF